MEVPHSQRLVLEHLTEQIRQCQQLRRGKEAEVVSSGIPALDRLLPAGGLHRGSLIEWVAAVPGSGVTWLALVAARAACGDAGLCVIVDRQGEFYPPAAAALGWTPEQMVIVRPSTAADEAWAMDQALRCGGVSAVLGWPARLDDHAFRRWQLAAEASGALGLILRPIAALAEPSWAEVKLLVTPLVGALENGQRRWKLEILHCRGTLRRGAQCEVCGEELESKKASHGKREPLLRKFP